METKVLSGEAGSVIDSFLADLSFLAGNSADENLRSLEDRVPGLSIASFETSPHVFSDGILGNYPYYFTYEDGKAWLRVGDEPLETPLYYSFEATRYSTEEMRDEKTFTDLLARLIGKLARAPFQYSFRGRKVHMQTDRQELHLEASDEEQLFHAWGYSSEDAFRKIANPSPELAKLGFPKELQQQLFLLQAVESMPIEQDQRRFPKTDPHFQVLD